ncbi:autophagy-related protein 3 [Pseudohyphozyma bogoriensis]|nr:autophagy-related protein 3 [Pseudohyphozyma bogoriensis]
MFGAIQTQFWSVRDYLAPVLRDSKFKESGRLTPDEFVAAGDFLVYKFPTWSWEAGEPGKKRDFLPDDKQYLVQRNVPCLRRVSQLAYGGGADEDQETLMSFAAGAGDGDGDGEDWVATHTNADPSASKEIPSIGDIPDADIEGVSSALAGSSIATGARKEEEEMPDMDDIPDMDDEDSGVVEEEDEAALKPVQPVVTEAGGDNLLQVRTYDCSITYDKYYQTPRMWLLGYDEHKSPLPPASALEDVSADHAQKTVTIEPFPHSSLSMASVHPCKHSSVMKKVIERMDAGVIEAQRKEKELEKKEGKGKWGLGKKKEKVVSKEGKEEEGPEGLRVDQYLVVFLKFMSSIVPTIEVDATNAI